MKTIVPTVQKITHKHPSLSGMGMAFLWVTILCLMNILTASQALAQESCGEGNTLGSVICSTVVNLSDVPGLISALSYLAAIYMSVSAIWATKLHVDDPNSTPIWDPVKRFVAGGALFAFPTIALAAWQLLSNGNKDGIDLTLGDTKGSAEGTGLDNIMVNFIADIFNNIFPLLGGFSYLAGLVFIFIGIMRLLKTEREGPQGPTGIGTLTTFAVAGALFALDPLMAAFTSSFFGTTAIDATPNLQTQAGLDAGEIQHINKVIQAIIAFMFIVGWISFIRGWFILRDISEGGSQNASMMGALTHLIGGALAVNLGPLMNVVQETLGIAEFGIRFGG